MAITQQQISDHLDLDQSAVSRFLNQLDIDWRTASLDTIRVAYIRKLRVQAAGHESQDGHNLVRERVMTERVDRELKVYTLAEKKGQLVNVNQLVPELMQMVAAFRMELLGRDDKLKADLDVLYGIEVDVQVLNVHTHAALSHLARYDISDTGGDITSGVVADAAGEYGLDGLGEAAAPLIG